MTFTKSLKTDCEVWKTITCSETDDNFPTISEAEQLKARYIELGIDRVLIDIPKESLQNNHQLQYQDLLTSENLVIAGGLTVESLEQLTNLQINQQQALNTNQQAGFDICSSLEQSAGKKDPEKMKLLFQHLLPKTRSRMT